MTTIPTLADVVDRMKREVRRDIQDGLIAVSVRSFSELHDYVDANEYGGFCEDAVADALIEHFGGRDEHEGMPQGMLDYINAAQRAVGEWLASNSLRV